MTGVEPPLREGAGMLRRKTIVAHRGVSGGEPENTLQAFGASVTRGVEAIELDVRQTADGVLVVSHDPAVRGVSIDCCTYETLAARVAGVCTLGEALNVIPSTCLLDVEIKVPDIERELLHELQLKREASDFAITSFCDETVARVKALNSGVQVGLLLGKDRPKHMIRTRLSEFFPGRRLRRSNADFVAANWRLLKFGFQRRMTRLGYPVHVWTVNEPELMKRLLQCPNVAAVITDRPVEAMALRAALK
jgi:glycerophosphoryl diester phosphodiesterase